MWQKCKIVILPTNDKVGFPFFIDISRNNILELNEGQNKDNWNYNVAKQQHLYIISDEEIKEGDWVHEITGEAPAFSDNSPRIKQSKNGYYNSGTWRKIIATTDSSLTFKTFYDREEDIPIHLPQIPQSFINLYIEEYNKGNKIEEYEFRRLD